MSDPDRASSRGGDHDETPRGAVGIAAWTRPDDAFAGPDDEGTLLAAALEAIEQSAEAGRHQAADLLAAVNSLISTCETKRDKEWETLADLSQKLDDLEMRLRERGDAESDDAFLKSALKAVEAGLMAFTQRRSPAAAPVEPANAPKRSRAESAAPALSAPSRAPALNSPSPDFSPFRSDLLARLNAAMPTNAAASIGSLNNFAELARKLDDMCRGGAPSRAQGSETIRSGGLSTTEEDAAARSEALGPTAAGGGETASETPAQDASAISRTGGNSDGMNSLVRLSGDAQTSKENGDQPSIIDALLSAVENSNYPVSDPTGLTRILSQMAGIRDPGASAVGRSLPIDKLERQLALLTEGLVTQSREDAPRDGGDLGRASATQTIEARLDALTRKAEEALAKGSDSARYDALAEQIEATHRQFAARLEASLAAASAETSALKDMVSSLTGKMEAVRDAKSTDLAIAALEREMAKVAERLNAADKAFASLSSLEQSIAGLFEQLEETRRTALEAVAVAERSGAHESSAAAWFGKAAAGESLERSAKGEIAEMRAARDAADQRVDLTLAALRETVDKVADRLVKVEADIGAMPSARLGSLPTPNLAPLFSQLAERAADDHDKIDPGASTPTLPAAAIRPVLKLPFENKPELDAKSIDAPEVLLEPGSGVPPQREKSRPPRAGAPPAISSNLKEEVALRADFIAAARRAAQAAQKESRGPAQGLPGPDAESESDPEPRYGLLDRARRLVAGLAGRKRPVVLGVAALVLAASAYALARTIIHTAAINNLTPALLEQLGKALVHREAQPPDATGGGSAHERPAAASPAAQPNAAPGPRDASQLVAPQSLSNPPIGPARPGPSHPARRAIAGSASILAGTFERADASRQISAAHSPDGPLPPAFKPSGPSDDHRAQAEAGDALAQFELGQRFAEGRDRPRNLELAAYWYEKAAQQGLAKAQYRLATLYERGLGAPRDLAQAIALYLAAAQQGNTRAMYNLGVLAADNPDGKPDYATAALWFAEAAEAGVRDSQFNLAVLLARGLGVPQDPIKAYTWFAIAAAQGDAEAAQKRDEIGARLVAADRAAAETAAETFRPRLTDQAANEEAGTSQAGSAAGAAANSGKPKVSGL